MDVRQVQLRVPADIKAWLEAQAQNNRSSQNSEVIRLVRAAMARTVVYESAENEYPDDFAGNSSQFPATSAVAKDR